MDSSDLPLRARMNWSLAQRLVVLGALALTACVQSEIINMRPGEAAPLSGKVSDVAVASGDIPLSRMGVYEEVGASHLIGEENISRLVDDDHFDESGNTRIIVRVTGFRLRSAANVILWAIIRESTDS